AAAALRHYRHSGRPGDPGEVAPQRSVGVRPGGRHRPAGARPVVGDVGILGEARPAAGLTPPAAPSFGKRPVARHRVMRDYRLTSPAIGALRRTTLRARRAVPIASTSRPSKVSQTHPATAPCTRVNPPKSTSASPKAFFLRNAIAPSPI